MNVPKFIETIRTEEKLLKDYIIALFDHSFKFEPYHNDLVQTSQDNPSEFSLFRGKCTPAYG